MSTSSESGRWIRAVALGCCVVIAGATVMVYEFLAIRFMQRFHGSSADIWGFEISVCLAGLAVGYWLGGRLADRFGSWRVFGLMILLGGTTAIPMEQIVVAVGNRLLQVEPRLWHPMLTAATSSFVPFVLLGTIMPQAIRLHVRDVAHVGASAGWIASLSTFGSIAGVLFTTLLLIPRVGVRESVWGTSAVLIVLGGAIILCATFASKRAVRTGPVAAMLLLAVLSPTASAQVRFEKYSQYHHILVQDAGQLRQLAFDSDVQTTMSLRDPYTGGFEYTEFFHVPMVLNPSVKKVLFLGLGGGTGPKTFLRNYPSIQIEAAEIDPEVIRVAHEYFGVPKDPRLNIVAQDARQYLQRSQGGYGAIVIDAYASGPYGASLPSHLATKEFMQIVHDKLDLGGCLVYNVVGRYGRMNSETVRIMQATIESVFPTTYAFAAQSTFNTVYVGVKLDASMVDAEGKPTGKAWPEGPWIQHPLTPQNFGWLNQELTAKGAVVQFPQFGRRLTQFDPVQGMARVTQIYTDNFAPVDLSIRKP